MLVDVVNTAKGFGYDEDGDPVVRDGHTWRLALGGWVDGATLHVKIKRGHTNGFVSIPLAAVPVSSAANTTDDAT